MSDPDADPGPPPAAQLFIGDCLGALATVPDASVGLCYLDPPFATGRRQQLGEYAYDDAWKTMDEYIAFMRPRLEAMRRCLDDQGAMLLHCDWRASHHLRLMLDDIFGADRFLNSLVWTYGLGGSSPKHFARKHDDILYYACGDEHYFEPPRVPATSNRMRGRMKKATDVLDIPAINNMARERAGYPTQKPLALLRLLISACARPGACVLDPFCGSGTSLIAAAERGHPIIGIDANPQAIGITQQRLAQIEGTPPCIELHIASASSPVSSSS